MSRLVSGLAIMAGATFRHSFPRARSPSDQNGHRLQGLALPRPTTARALDRAVRSRAFRRGEKGTTHSGTWGHLPPFWPRWSRQIRPWRVTPNLASGPRPGHVVVVPRRRPPRQEVFDLSGPSPRIPAILASPGRRIVATQGCDPSADPGAGMAGRRPAAPEACHSGAKAINPRGLGTESPSRSI